MSRSLWVCISLSTALFACGPKSDPIGRRGESEAIAETEEPAAPTPMPWDDQFGALEVTESLHGETLTKADAGPWERRRNTTHEAAPGGSLGTLGDMPAMEGGTVIGHGGLGSRGTGFGGGGGAEGLGGLGTHGYGGAGSSGYGRGSGAVASKGVGATGVTSPAGGKAAARKEEAIVRGEAVPAASRPVEQAALKAGTTDDNANFDAYTAYVAEWKVRPGINGWADTLNVVGRRWVEVVDASGRPQPDARVSIVDPTADRVVWAGRTFGDGRMPVYPQLVVPHREMAPPGTPSAAGWRVEVETASGARSTLVWPANEDSAKVVVNANREPVGGPIPIDVCFIIDTTGSMGDEIARVKETLLRVTSKLRSDSAQGVDLRYGAVLYRDIGDEYVTLRHPFTLDLQAFDAQIQTIQAGGGGDGPESLNQGLAVGVAGMDWRENAARVAFLIADAPPHMDYQEDVTYGRAAAAAMVRGIRVHTVAASGLDDPGSFAFRQIAQLTRGQFIFIEYGSVTAAAADHGVAGPVSSNNLDDILYGRIRAEIDGWGRASSPTVVQR